MCTAITFRSKDHYFGRNLDLDHTYNESVVITPRNYPFTFRCMPELKSHYAMIGMAATADGYPLYYEATNEYGLSMAGLNFPGNAVYLPTKKEKDNITPFEFVPWILAQCKTVSQAKTLLSGINLADIPFSEELSLTDLHWIIADKECAVVVEPGEAGLEIYDDPVGVLTNNPVFPYHMRNLTNYKNLTPFEPKDHIDNHIVLKPDSLGMGAIGLPGDATSQSRFVRTAYIKYCSPAKETENESVSQFFHILDSASVVDGVVRIGEKTHKTIYTSCCNIDKGIYYYKTYNNSRISAVSLFDAELDANQILSFPLVKEQQIFYQNKC